MKVTRAAALLAVPVASTDLPFNFELSTADLQAVTIQAKALVLVISLTGGCRGVIVAE
jgi:hypothetical protein